MTAISRSHEQMMHRLVTLHREGLSCRALARTLDLSRHRVRRLLAVYTGTGRPPARPPLVSAPTTSSTDEDTTT
jgi:transposase